MNTYNCSLSEESENLSKFQFKRFPETLLLKLGEFIFVTSVVVALHSIDIVTLCKFRLKKLKLDPKTIVQILLLSVLMLTLPFITLLITGILLYKVLCSIAIRRKDKRFVEFLDSFDVFYCLEDKNTIEVEGIIQSHTIELAVDNIKEKLQNLFVNYGTDKIFYRRNEEYGFYYWRRYSFIDLAQYVQITEVPDVIEENMTVIIEKPKHIKSLVSYNDEGLFKVFITKNNQGNDEKPEYKITLKFHKSVKDDALVQLIACLVKTSGDCLVTLHSTPNTHNQVSPDVIMNMISKLCDILSQTLEESQINQDRIIRRPKTLEWTKSNENLFSKIKHAYDFNYTVVKHNVLNKVMGNLER